MHVALNWLFMHPRAGGVGTAAREVVPRLLALPDAPRITILTGPEADPVRASAAWADEVTWVRTPVTVTHGPPLNFVRTMLTQWAVHPLLAARRRADVLHGMANSGALVAPGVATVMTLHDLIWMAHPTVMTPRDRFGTRWTTIPAARAADLLLADSQAGKDVAVQRLGLDPGRIEVVPLAAAPPRVAPAAEGPLRERLGLVGAPVLLVVSQKRAHKNLGGVVRALAALRRPEVRVVIPGAPTPFEAELRALAAGLGVGEQLLLPTWLEQDELEALYAMARGVVLPSFEEGFGLPVLEAMVRGVPVGCSAVSALGEVAGNAALLFDPAEPGQIAAVMRRLLDDEAERSRLRAAGRERAASFTWERTARRTLDAYAVAVERRRLLSWDGR